MGDTYEFRQFESLLDKIDWRRGNREAIPEATELLQYFGADRLRRLAAPAIKDVLETERILRKRARVQLNMILPASEEWRKAIEEERERDRLVIKRPTHTKLLIGGTRYGLNNKLYNDNPYGFKIWMHLWDNNPASRFADQDHDHRYDLAGVIVGTGSYRMTLRRCANLALSRSEVWMPTITEWENPEMDKKRIIPGEAWWMSALGIHAVSSDHVAPVSMVIQGPRQRDKSYVFHEATGKISGEFSDYHGAVEHLYMEDNMPY